MKITILLSLFFFSLYNTYGQTTIWSEDFESYADHAGVAVDNQVVNPAVDWTHDGAASANKVRTVSPISGSASFLHRNGISTWTSESIDISGYTNVTITLNLNEITCEAGDKIETFYNLDGAGAIEFGDGNGDGDFDNETNTVGGLSGSNLVITVLTTSNQGNDKHRFDDIDVSGTVIVALDNGPGSGNSLDFDGSDDYVDIGDIAIDGLSEVTIEAWINPTSLRTNGAPSGHNANEGAIVHKSGSSDDNLGLTATTAGLAFYIDNGSDNLLMGSVPSTNVWTHVAATYDGSDLMIYINGVLDNTTSSTGSGNLINNTNNLRIGGGHIVSHEFNGKIDEVRIWSEARSQLEIRDNMCQKLIGNETNLLNYYRMDESTGSTLSDHVGSNDGALTNMSNVDWVTSGAALGDASTYLYTGAWAGQEIYLQSAEGDSMSVSTVSGSPDGVHIYYVTENPNVSTGIIGAGANDHYFGVFKTGGTSPTYTGTYYYRENDAFQLGSNESGLIVCKRDDNEDPTWEDASATLNTAEKTLTMTNLNTEMFLGNSVTPLPIDLVSFTANVNDDRVDLKWLTSTEINNDYFTIERSVDGVLWEEIGVVVGAGNSFTPLDYQFTDQFPIEGSSYYRLKQTDFDNKQQHHQKQEVFQEDYTAVASSVFQMELYPNPVQDDQFFIKLLIG
ncbi:MAG: LamG domain-containing protein, partial [Saprospiraceae bacterium]|nr:LamG domain-containing protein [Saprospiraceae bacterium]